ncbi:MAG TPA: EamA family transporter, partial [Nitrospiria bacterium]
STYLAIRFAIETLPPFLMAGARFMIAGAVLYAWRRLRGDAAPSRPEWRSAAMIGILLLLGGNGGVVYAQQWVPSGLAALLVTTVPLWMVLMDLLHPSGRRPGRPAVAGVAMGFAGVALLIGPAQVAGQAAHVDLVGAAVLMLASLSWAIGSLYHRGARLPSSPLLAVGMEMLAGGAGLLILGMLTGELSHLNLAAVTARSFWSWAYLVVFGSWVGFAAYVWLLRAAPTPLVSTYAYVNPLVAVLLGHFFAGESVTSRVAAATAVIVGSVALTTWKPAESSRD